MEASGWLQLAALGIALLVGARLLGAYIARVFSGEPLREDRVFGPVEGVIYRVTGVTPESEQRWTAYARSVLAFSAVSVLGLYVLQRVQGALFLNPTDVTGVPPALAFNTAVSFVTNTNWQNYAGESTMSHLTQMSGLTVQNFVSAAVGIAVAIALVRGVTRRRSETIGNFWVDLTRTVTRILLPLSIVLALVLVARGAIQSFDGFTEARTLEGATQAIPGGPFASQEAIKELGTNGGGTLNANSAHPLSNPTPFTNLLEIFALLLIPFSLGYAYGRLAKDTRQGWAVLAAMAILWAGSAALAGHLESQSNPRIEALGVVGTNMEGKEARFGAPVSGIFAASTTGTSTGAVDSAHDSFTPLGGAVPLVNMMLGEVSPGGVGAGLYGILVFAILSVFVAGLMVGRTPEYLGKRIGAQEMKLVMLYLLAVPTVVLGFSGVAVLLNTVQDVSIFNPGAHGLSEVVYAYTSASNNNGSAFGGLTGNTDWFNTTLGVAMLCGRFVLIVLVLAIAGALGLKQPVPPSAGTFPTGTPTFTGLLVAVVLIVVGLTYLPMLALGPILEHLQL
jgi:potassium-transporting ATPase potassium-binding subunit